MNTSSSARSVAFKTLGCRLNQYETDALETEFRNGGYTVCNFEEPADVYVINTCTVTSQSDQKSRQAVHRAARQGKNPVVVVTGCLATRNRDALEKDDVITYVVENKAKNTVFGLVEGHFNREILHPRQPDLFAYGSADGTSRTRSFVKIQDGCDNLCTFCIIPFVRGRAESRPASAVLDNIRAVLDAGYRECVLTGVNIGRYRHEGISLGGLLQQVVELPYDFRVRISSIEPDGFDETFYEMLAHPRVAPHLHLCLQSGSDRILRRMRRMYSVAEFMNVVESIRAKVEDFNFTTDVMVGFPGESDADHAATLDVCRNVGFSHIHTFKYSRREGTRADRMDDQVNETCKKARSEDVRSLALVLKRACMEHRIGSIQRLLVEQVENGMASGYGEHYLPVQAAVEPGTQAGQFCDVQVSGVEGKGAELRLTGTPLPVPFEARVAGQD